MTSIQPKIKLFLLGSPRVEVNGKMIPLSTLKAQALLAFLAMDGARHSRERLATFLWGNTSEKRARSSLRNALYILRDALGEDVFILERNYVSLKTDEVWVDVKELEYTVKEKFVTLKHLQELLALWRAPFLDGVAFSNLPSFDEWFSRERERSWLFYLDVWLRLSKLFIVEGRYSEALEAARKLLDLDPLSESAYHHIMRLYLMCGDRVAALKVFEDLKTCLKEGLGLEPSPNSYALQSKALKVNAWLSEEKKDDFIPVSLTQSQKTFVGRSGELEQLSAQLRATLPVGPARMVLLSGEPGIGKTSLFSAWKDKLDLPLVLSAHSFETQKNAAYDLWAQLIRASFKEIASNKISIPERWLSELASILPELFQHYPELPRLRYDDSELARDRLAEAIYHWASALTQNQPLCLFIDDLQWSDHASLQVLVQLLEQGEELPLYIVGTQRTSEMDEKWHEFEEELGKLGLFQEIRLKRLSLDEVGILIATLELQPKNPVTFLSRIYQETSGNPLFVVEMAQAIHNFDLDKIVELPIPSTIQGVIRARLSRLSKETRDVIEFASLLAQNFDSEFLQSAGDFPARMVSAALSEARKGNILVQQVDKTYQFSHNKIRGVMVADLEYKKRKNYHLRIAQILEMNFQQGENIEVERISYHYENAGELALTVEFALRAAKRAVELYVDEDAIGWYDHAFKLLADKNLSLVPDKLPALTPFEQILISEKRPLDALGFVYRQRGIISQRRGNYAQAEEDFRFALTRAQKRNRLDEQGASHNLLSFLAYLRSEYDLVAKHAQNTLDFGTKADIAQLRGAGLRNLGIAAYHTQDFDRALKLYEEALVVYKSVDDKVGIATCYNNNGFAFRTLRQYEKAIAAFQNASTYYEEAGQMEGQALILANIGRTYASQGDLEKALDYLERAHQLSEEIRTDWITVKVWRTKGRVFTQNKRWKEALEAALEAQSLAEALGSNEDTGACYRLLGEIASSWTENTLGSPEEYFRKSITILEKVGEQHELQRSLDSLEKYKNKI